MSIREQIKTDSGIDLPIKSGMGNTISNAVIIERTKDNDYVETEYAFLDFIYKNQRVSWEVVLHQLVPLNGKRIDKLKVETKLPFGDEMIVRTEHYYFDITECFDDKALKQRSRRKTIILQKVADLFTGSVARSNQRFLAANK